MIQKIAVGDLTIVRELTIVSELSSKAGECLVYRFTD